MAKVCVGVAVGDAGALAAGAPPAGEGGLADRALAVYAGLVVLVRSRGVPEVVVRMDAQVDVRVADSYCGYTFTSKQIRTESNVARTTKSIRLAEEHQELLKLLAAFEHLSEGELVEQALESFVHARVLAYRKTLGLSRNEVDVRIEDAGELVARLREAMARAIAEGGHAPSEDEIKAGLRQRAAERRGQALADAAVPA